LATRRPPTFHIHLQCVSAASRKTQPACTSLLPRLPTLAAIVADAAQKTPLPLTPPMRCCTTTRSAACSARCNLPTTRADVLYWQRIPVPVQYKLPHGRQVSNTGFVVPPPPPAEPKMCALINKRGKRMRVPRYFPQAECMAPEAPPLQSAGKDDAVRELAHRIVSSRRPRRGEARVFGSSLLDDGVGPTPPPQGGGRRGLATTSIGEGEMVGEGGAGGPLWWRRPGGVPRPKLHCRPLDRGGLPVDNDGLAAGGDAVRKGPRRQLH
jgi:hypothetical protein